MSNSTIDAVDAVGLRERLARSVRGEVRFDRLSRALYSTDASVYQIVPVGVVIPTSAEDVAAVVEACTEFGVPITPRGGGTSLAGQAVGRGLHIDFSKYLNRILEIDPLERWVRVEPGCVLDELNAQVRAHGLQFAPDVSTSNRATIGGMIGNNSCGARSIIYGKTVDHVLELRVILADGRPAYLRSLSESELAGKLAEEGHEGDCYRIVRQLATDHAVEIEKRYPKILRRVGGYNLDLFTGHNNFNLAHLLTGSEGTLGVVTEAKVRLVPLPAARGLLVIQFAGLRDALAAMPLVLGHRPSAVEVLDRTILDSTLLNPEYRQLRDFLHGDPEAILLVEFSGDEAAELSPRFASLERELRGAGMGNHFHVATAAPAQARIWKLRKAALGLAMAQKGDAKTLAFVEDTAVDPAHLMEYVREFADIIARHGTQAGVYGHASVGCLHVRPIVNLKTKRGVEQFAGIADDVANLVLKYGGALSGEHGDGLIRSPFQERMFGPVLYEAFRRLKRAFDPKGIFNPGKIVDAPPLTANLRYGAAYVTPDVPTTFDFSADGGIVRAAELCSGVGACRKKREGVMCPSYQATREEQHSTRGRANALRLALTGQMGFTGLTDPDLKGALDLCLECKACKTECPTNVDMARLKAEFLHQYHEKHGLPLRNRFLGEVASLARFGSLWAPMSNWLMRSGPVRWLNDRFLGIDRRRIPPPFARRTLAKALRDLRLERLPENSDPRVLLFPDTFTMYFEPEIGVAAVDLLQRTGCLVVPGDWLGTALRCCGRPQISNGMLAQAVANARHNVRVLHAWARLGRPIFACEPSCILTIRDDYPALLRGEERRQAEVVASACMTFEELLEAKLANGAGTGAVDSEKSLAWKRESVPSTVLLQGHCHQRALVGMNATLRLLRRTGAAEIVDVDAGCCGMAGSFGYEKEHYEVSRLVGEQRLFPAIRAAGPETAIVAPGFSCRMQIQHFTGRRAVHPAEFLHALLEQEACASTSSTTSCPNP